MPFFLTSVSLFESLWASEIGSGISSGVSSVAKPVSIMVDSFGTSKYTDEQLEKAVEKVFDCRPNSIIRQLKLTETKYLPVAAYGHIGREDLNVRWEDTDKTEELISAIK